MLDLACVIGNAMGDGGKFHAVLQPWQDTKTWNDWVNGIQADGVEAAVTPTATAGNSTLNPNVQAAFLSFELTPDVQAWANSSLANYGWAILPWTGGGDGWGMGTSEQTTERNRPQLRVFYTPSIVLLAPVWSPGSVQLPFRANPNDSYLVLRAPEVTGPWTTNGSASTGLDGNATYTDSTPLPGRAFYRVYHP